MKKMVFKSSWNEFRNSGLLWFVNTILHMFGWALVMEFNDKNKLTNAYPARVKFRGFDNQTNSKGYIKVTTFLKKNINALLKEAKE